MTPQRELLLRTLEEAGGHLDAEELFLLAREHDPRLSLSTVYRTLNVLKKMGLVEELHLGEEHHHYEVTSPAEHHHLICTKCGAVIEFESRLIEQMKREVAEEHGFEISGMHVDLMGLCARCRKRR
jgi:Fe2+ or Zn2+ uptake regulation protein